MLSHDRVWAAIDALAERYSLSASGLAKRAGLDSTAFNKSKRLSADGRPRWPSTESLAKIMEATGATLDEFMELVEPARPKPANAVPDRPLPVQRPSVPLIGFAQAGAGGFFDDAGFPVGEGWDTIRFPGLEDEAVYALEISGNSMEPVYREGDRVIVAPAAQMRRGDRVIVKTREGEILAKTLGRSTDTIVELISANPDYPTREVPRSDLRWIARILWASQ